MPIESLLPPLIMLAMVIVGLELTPADLLRALHEPRRTALALAAQLLLLPLLAAGLAVILELDAIAAGGLVLVAAAAQAPVSNYFCVLGRADVALSVTLTALSSVIATFTMPWAAQAGFDLIARDSTALQLPAAQMVRYIATALLLPLAAGMLVRHLAPAFVARNRGRMQWASVVLLAALLGSIAFDQAATIAQRLGSLVVSSALFTLIAALLGVAVARLAGWPGTQALTMFAAFPARSLSMATLVAVGILGRTQFLSFAVVFFLVQAAMLVPAMLWARRRVGAATAAGH
ncbi:MAG: bile acid:sodium symporter [Burkholderiales bacterium]|nr:bile acid:sodium symporter [Burkholderiales bacterium]